MMGSKNKKEVPECSNSSLDSDSDNCSKKRSKCKSKKEVNTSESNSDTESARKSAKKAKSEPKTRKGNATPGENEHESSNHRNRIDKKSSHRNEEVQVEDQRRRRQSPTQGSRDRHFRDDRRKDRGRSDEHNNNNDRYRRSQHYRNRNRRDDRERDYRNRRGDFRSHNRNRDRSHNRENKRRGSRSPSFDHTNAKWGKDDGEPKGNKTENKEKQKPNFTLSGKLTEETNTYRGVVIKYSEPPEARKPKRRWRLYPFKGEKALQTLYIHRESAYLIGRDRKVVDLPVDHPSCSKQHAVLQYRLVPFTREDGSTGKRVRPYIIDLNSANGTYINNKKIEPSKYVELLEKDVIKFGYSSREYVLLHENSKDEAQDDDVKQEEEEVAVKNEGG